MNANVSFSIDAIDYKLIIENEESKVSPGGELKFKVVGSDHNTGFSIYSLFFDLDDNSFVDKFSASQMSWAYQVNLSHPRYAKVKIKDEISGDLPKSVKLKIYSNWNKQDKVAEADFSIVEGTYGHNEYKDKYVKDIIADKKHRDGKHAWYRISCMSGGTCNINIKDGEHDKYNGQQPRISHHSASDRNYPGTSSLKVGEPVIFDARDLIVENTNSPSSPGGYLTEMNAVIRLSSDNPIMVEPLDVDYIAKKV